MALSRLLAGWALVTLFLVLWREATRRLQRTAGPWFRALRASLLPLATEALLLALFAGLWFGSLGSGSAWLLFLVLGLLMEIPSRLRDAPIGGLPWKVVIAGVLRIVLAGTLLQIVLG